MLSIFCTVTNPTRRGDAWLPALQCYTELADEVVVINGGTEKLLNLPPNVKVVDSEWPQEFSWELIGQKFQEGYENCTGDWVIHCDLDFIFHERDYNLIRRVCQDSNQPALSFYKYQFVLPDRYNLKSRLVIAVNKGKFGSRIKFNSAGDLCQPSLDGKELSPNDVQESKIPFYNYEKLTKDYDQVFDDVGRMARAWHTYWGSPKLGGDAEEAFDKWAEMLKGRFTKPQKRIDITEHPQVMWPVILGLKKHQFGYDGFGMLERNDYVKDSSGQ